MTEALKRREDQLAALREAIISEDVATIDAAIGAIARTAPELRDAACDAVSAFGDEEAERVELRKWAESFFVGGARSKAPALRRDRRKIEVKRERGFGMRGFLVEKPKRVEQKPANDEVGPQTGAAPSVSGKRDFAEELEEATAKQKADV